MTCAEFQRVLPDAVGGVRSAEQEAHLQSCRACSGLVSDLDVIARESRLLHAADEPAPQVWHSIHAVLQGWESEMHAISTAARTLQASEEPSPKVWNGIQATLQEWDAEVQALVEEVESLQATDEPSPRVWNSLEIALRNDGLIRRPQRSRSLVEAFRGSWSRAWLVPAMAAVMLAFGLTLYRPAHQDGQVASGPAVKATLAGFVPSSRQMTADEDNQVLAVLSSRTPSLRDKYAADLRNVNAYIHDAEQSLQTDPNDELAQQSLMDAYEQKQVVYEMALDRSLP